MVRMKTCASKIVNKFAPPEQWKEWSKRESNELTAKWEKEEVNFAWGHFGNSRSWRGENRSGIGWNNFPLAIIIIIIRERVPPLWADKSCLTRWNRNGTISAWKSENPLDFGGMVVPKSWCSELSKKISIACAYVFHTWTWVRHLGGCGLPWVEV